MVFSLENIYSFIDAVASLDFWDGDSYGRDEESFDDERSRRIRRKNISLSSSRRRRSSSYQQRVNSRDLRATSSTRSTNIPKQISNPYSLGCPSPVPTASLSMSETSNWHSSDERSREDRCRRKPSPQEAFNPTIAQRAGAKKTRQHGVQVTHRVRRERKEKTMWAGKTVNVGLFSGPY